MNTPIVLPSYNESQNIVFGLVMKKIPTPEQEERFKELVKLFHLDELGDRYLAAARCSCAYASS